MVDPRGGGLTVGLGLAVNLAVVAHAEADVADHHRRTLELVEPGESAGVYREVDFKGGKLNVVGFR